MTKLGNSKYALCVIVLLAGAIALAQTQAQPSSSSTGQTQAQPSSSSTTGVQVNPSEVQKKANTPPPAGTKKTSSVGQKTQVATPADSDSWAEQLDADGNGTPEPTNLVWDGADKILFSDSSGTFTCKNGTTGTGELLVAVNGSGNKRGRPAGSGYWIASMDKGQCGVRADALWGCKFDASGTATACGVATIDQQNNDIVLVTAER